MTAPRKIAVAVVALMLSGALHAAGLVRLAPSGDLALAGGRGDAVPRLGDSFADMAQGAALSVPAGEHPVAPLEAVAVNDAAAMPVTATPTAPVAGIAADPVTTALTAPMPEALAALVPEAIAEAVAVPSPAAMTPVAPAAAPLLVAPEAETLFGTTADLDTAAPLRPRQRPEGLAAKASPDPKPAPKPKASAPAGNADRNATRGSATGAENATGTTASGNRAGPQGEGGTATSASYGREVLTRINRTRKQNAPARGRTIVAFSINEAGALASVKVVKSSGSAALDAVALDHIRRAAPFPKPPAGAARQFSFEFVGRS